VGELEEKPRFQLRARKVILAIPPRLAASTILFTPDLTHTLTQAMLKCSTWMAGQAKFCGLYDRPCWREQGLSGQAFSQRGPLGEVHDGSNNDQKPFGLMGFLNVPASQRRNIESFTVAVLSQFESLYGKEAARPGTVFYQDWAKERYTATQFDQPPAGKTAIWDGVIHFAGSETSSEHGGYLEGALVSAKRAVRGL